MISFFTTAKEFSGLIEVIQGNALRSWNTLHPECEVILLGDDGGAAAIARELDLIHVPDVARNEYGSALVSDLFAQAHAHASHDLLCYVNADIILTSDLIRAAHQLDQLLAQVGQRLDRAEPDDRGRIRRLHGHGDFWPLLDAHARAVYAPHRRAQARGPGVVFLGHKLVTQGRGGRF